MVEGKAERKISKERMFYLSFFPPRRLLSLCWIVLFDLECSERRALCNISGTHMAVCVTAKHIGGAGVAAVAVVLVVGRCGERREGGRGRLGRRGESGSRGSCRDVRGGTRLLTLVSARFPY